MTNMPEAKLAREAELCYASVAMITDYDSWHPDHGEVDVTKIIATLMGNADKARNMVARLPGLLGAERDPCPHGCDRALEFAMITQPTTATLRWWPSLMPWRGACWHLARAAQAPLTWVWLDPIALGGFNMDLSLWMAFTAASMALAA